MTLSSSRRIITAVLLLVFGVEQLMPPVMIALTSGPAQPEFSSFEPVRSADMVNEFTGAFTYNLPLVTVPGPNGSGYPLSLSYHSGSSVEEEASWVGYGWTLNAGSITRNTQGYPDDAYDVPITRHNKVDPIWTATAKLTLQTEFASIDELTKKKEKDWRASLSLGLRYNSMRGFSFLSSMGLTFLGGLSLSFSLEEGEGSFSANVNPAALLNRASLNTNKESEYSKTPSSSESSNALGRAVFRQLGNTGVAGAAVAFSDRAHPTVLTPYSGTSFLASIGVTANLLPLPIGIEGIISGAFTRQANDPHTHLRVYGHLYTGRARAQDVQDYSTEKLNPFTKRDYFLGIPVSNPDRFVANAEGLSGTFSARTAHMGQYTPNQVSSSTVFATTGASPHLGPYFGPGFSISGGGTNLTIGGWSDSPSLWFDTLGQSSWRRPVFRFDNDLGGSVNSGSGDVQMVSNDSFLTPALNNGSSVGRSIFVGYHTNAEMQKTTDLVQGGTVTPVPYLSEARSSTTRGFVNRSRTADGFQNQIGEFYSVNQSGMRYVFGLPVYSRNEKSLSYGMADPQPGELQSMYLAFRDPAKLRRGSLVGEERAAPYASSYLLTDITTPDYVDRTQNGSTLDDFGGYTHFEYRRAAGSDIKDGGLSSQWYHWRMPYRGMLYNRNTLSSPSDDMGSVQSGEREVYYMKAVETKTHVAVFVTNRSSFTYRGHSFTGSQLQRKDAYEAVMDENVALRSSTATTAGGDNKIEYLERIELYALDSAGGCGRKLQTSHFNYDYSLSPNLPNSASDGDGGTVGKLTLRKVWSEYEGTVSARLAPYIFGYQYRDPSFYSPEIREKYRLDSIAEYGSKLDSSEQNPSYSPFNSDRWGSYCADGAARHAGLNKWVDQTPADTAFDPAAWQLKWIRLPSGGELQVQYQQSDYLSVQNRPAMAMASLVHGPRLSDSCERSSDTFYVNVQDDLGVRTMDELKKIREKADSLFVSGPNPEHIYFRFVASLDNRYVAGVDQCASELISGYLKVRSVTTDTTLTEKKLLRIVVGSTNPAAYSKPVDVIKNFVRHETRKDMGGGATCTTIETPDPSDPLAMLVWLAEKIGDVVIDPALSTCTLIDAEHSLMRLPVLHAKKGGGIRVKRILMYNPGMEKDDDALYGTEYLYTGADSVSSGVASNEPTSGREENALVGYLQQRRDRDWLERAISGQDLEQQEGPIGESYLPAPVVGYSRVVSRPIHSGATGGGFTIKTFYTTRDYPFNGRYGKLVNPDGSPARGVEYTGEGKGTQWLYLPWGTAVFQETKVTAEQGYRFIVNSMNGQPRSVMTYSGSYADPDSWSSSSRSVYEYFEPGEAVPMYSGINATSAGYPGRQIDVTVERRATSEVTGSVTVDADPGFAAFFIAIIPMPSFYPDLAFNESGLRTHVVNKVIQYPAIVKAVTTTADGVEKRVENIAFNPRNGQPLVTRTTDGYDGLALEQSSPQHIGIIQSTLFPASSIYSGLGQRGANEGLRLISNTVSSPFTIERRILSAGEIYLNMQGRLPGVLSLVPSLFFPGDLIALTRESTGEFLGLYTVTGVQVPRVILRPVSFNKATITPLEICNVEIVRSGRTNQLDASVGGITTYGQPSSPFLCPGQ